jgi:sigma-B regulation protein RsbU (phosphoserine phosphatase)
MITLVYGIIDPETGSFHYCNAGHPAPRLFTSDREAQPRLLGPTGRPVGMFEGGEWRSETIEIPRGGLLMMHTDGVEDTLSEGNVRYDAGRMIAAVRRAGDIAASNIKDALLDDLAMFRGAMPQYDDLTIVVVGRK